MGVHQQPVFSGKSRSPSYRRKAADGGAKHRPFGLAPDALLAKIDALQADLPTTVFVADEPDPAPAPKSRFPLWAAALAGMAAAVLAMVAWQSLDAEPPPAPLPVVVAEPAVEPPPAVPVVAAPEPQPAVAATAGTVKLIDDTARRRAAAAEKKRKAEEARLAREEEERRLRAEEEARLAAERAEAERRARAAAVPVAPPAPKGPASPQELCAGESGFARSNCEARACSEPQWRGHAYCLKRWDEQMRRLNSGY